ncbi:MAG TPA: hypothetical protein VGK73_31065 [Polyangiaceae bacterium]
MAESTAPAASVELAVAAPPPVPYAIALERWDVPGLPGLHSMVSAVHAGKVVLLGGRRNGLHGFPAGRDLVTTPSFPRTEANDEVFVLDLAAKKLLGRKSVKTLPPALAGQLAANNLEATTRGGFLYLVGGYGVSPEAKTLTTLPRVTAVRLDALIATVLDPAKRLDLAFAAANMPTATHLALAVTGGELGLFGDTFALVFGHRYEGEYTPGGGQADQSYTSSVRAFRFTLADGPKPKLDVKYLGENPDRTNGAPPDNPFHRRDLVVASSVTPDGNPALLALGGVFKGGQMEGYITPVTVTPNASAPVGLEVAEDSQGQQLLSHYACAHVALFDRPKKALYTLLFGGISQYHWDKTAHKLIRDPQDLSKGIDGLPFIDSVSTLVRTPKSGGGIETVQYLHDDQTFPPAGAAPTCAGTGGAQAPAMSLGAEADFILDPRVATLNGDVVDLAALTAPMPLGWIVGGIAATAPYGAQGPTCASTGIYRVSIDPKRANPVTRLSL